MNTLGHWAVVVARFRTSYQISNGTLVVVVSGRVDASKSSDLEEAFRKGVRQHDPVSAVIGDFEGISAISSAGLRAVLVVAKWMRARGTKFALCAVNRNARHVFSVSGFDQIIRVFPSRAAALTSLRDYLAKAGQGSES